KSIFFHLYIGIKRDASVVLKMSFNRGDALSGLQFSLRNYIIEIATGASFKQDVFWQPHTHIFLIHKLNQIGTSSSGRKRGDVKSKEIGICGISNYSMSSNPSSAPLYFQFRNINRR